MANDMGLSDEEYGQLEQYAAMSGMSVEQYVQFMSTQPKSPQAPTNAYNKSMGYDTTGVGKPDIGQLTRSNGAATSNITNENTQKQQAAFDKYVAPQTTAFNTAAANQLSGNREAEGIIRDSGNTLNSSLNATQAQRTAAIGSTNASQTQALNTLLGQNQAANQFQTQSNNTYQGQLSGATAAQNQANSQFQGELGQYNQQANANNSQFQGQLSGLSAQQSAANSALQGQLHQSNQDQLVANEAFTGSAKAGIRAQDIANSTLQNKLGQYDAAGDDYTRQLSTDLGALNTEDQNYLTKYMQNTDPLLARREAQGSDPKYVQQQQDQYDLYKSRSGVGVTGEERLLAEQLRRKNENDDKSSRDATYEQMKARGLNSGGQQIAAQLAQRQATSSDRSMMELGIQANAVGRAERNTAGAAGVANQLRNADDGMRQFQDQYAQNESQRLQGVAQGQVNTQMANTAQRGGRDKDVFTAQNMNLQNKTGRAGMGFDANTQTNQFGLNANNQIFQNTTATNNANTGRNIAGFDATTQTVNGNTGRASLGFEAGRNTINDNTQRSTLGFNANTTTNENNTARATAGFNGNTTTQNANSQRDQSSFDGVGTTNRDNFARSSTGFDGADRNAGVAYQTGMTNANTIIGNRGAEVGTAATGSNIGQSTFGIQSGITGQDSEARIAAINKMFGNQLVGFASDDEDEN
jgi:hypothetical protein